MAEDHLSAEFVRACLDYDPATGRLSWKGNPRGRARSGGPAGTPAPNGYIRIRINGRCYAAHRLAYLIMNGVWPKHQIDHVNRVRDDNRWANLRDATQSQNMRNRHLSDGEVGVYRSSNGKGWKVLIHIGTYQTKELAAAARLNAEAILGRR